MQTYCPYRICPLGAHIDHQYGIVSGAAINLGITFDYEMIEERKIIISSINYEGIKEIDINDYLEIKNDWADYFRGVVKYLKRIKKIEKGLIGRFKGDLPSGGISSSSSSMIAFMIAICNINNIKISKEEIIDITYRVEREYMKLNIGKLDMSMEVLSKENSLVFLDTLTNYYKIVENTKFDIEYEFVIVYSGIKRNLINTKYNTRIEELNNSYKKLEIENGITKKLRDIPDYYYENNKYKLNEIEKRRCEHYYSEIKRVKEGLRAWRNNDIKTFSKLMNESCESSIKNYESGSECLISLYDISKGIEGVMGFRFLGAGFNGSGLCLIKKERYFNIVEEFKKKYKLLYDYTDFKIIPIKITNGVNI